MEMDMLTTLINFILTQHEVMICQLKKKIKNRRDYKS